MLREKSRELSSSEIDLSTGQMRSIATASDGSRIHYAFGVVHVSKWDAWLSSASVDPTTSQANLEQFEAVLKRVRS
jgi:hypothetical protein